MFKALNTWKTYPDFNSSLNCKDWQCIAHHWVLPFCREGSADNSVEPNFLLYKIYRTEDAKLVSATDHKASLRKTPLCRTDGYPNFHEAVISVHSQEFIPRVLLTLQLTCKLYSNRRLERILAFVRQTPVDELELDLWACRHDNIVQKSWTKSYAATIGME